MRASFLASVHASREGSFLDICYLHGSSIVYDQNIHVKRLWYRYLSLHVMFLSVPPVGKFCDSWGTSWATLCGSCAAWFQLRCLDSTWLHSIHRWLSMAKSASWCSFRTYAPFELKYWQLRISRWPPLQSLQWTQRLRLWNTNTGAGRVWGGEVSWALSALRKFGDRQMFCFLQYHFNFKSVWPNFIWSLVDAWHSEHWRHDGVVKVVDCRHSLWPFVFLSVGPLGNLFDQLTGELKFTFFDLRVPARLIGI